jgi:hypothetical protein
MIYYNPLDNDVLTSWIDYNSRSCCIMTQLGSVIPSELNEILSKSQAILNEFNFKSFEYPRGHGSVYKLR